MPDRSSLSPVMLSLPSRYIPPFAPLSVDILAYFKYPFSLSMYHSPSSADGETAGSMTLAPVEDQTPYGGELSTGFSRSWANMTRLVSGAKTLHPEQQPLASRAAVIVRTSNAYFIRA